MGGLLFHFHWGELRQIPSESALIELCNAQGLGIRSARSTLRKMRLKPPKTTVDGQLSYGMFERLKQNGVEDHHSSTIVHLMIYDEETSPWTILC